MLKNISKRKIRDITCNQKVICNLIANQSKQNNTSRENYKRNHFHVFYAM